MIEYSSVFFHDFTSFAFSITHDAASRTRPFCCFLQKKRDIFQLRRLYLSLDLMFLDFNVVFVDFYKLLGYTCVGKEDTI